MANKGVDPEVISNFLAEQRDDAPADSQHLFLEFEDLWERKLWHELTLKLESYFMSLESKEQRLPIFVTFITSFADKLNQLAFVSLGIAAAENIEDEKERLRFNQTLASKVDKPASQDAYVHALDRVAAQRLRLDQLEEARVDLDKAEKILDTFDSVEEIIHADFYRTNADYYQMKGDYAKYYKNALLYLACIDIERLGPNQRGERAYKLAIAALVSETIYNFGELLLHPILDALKAPSPHAWLRDLLFAFNRGDLRAFERLSQNLSKDPQLQEARNFLHQKICLAALTELVFRRPPHDRTMTFETISRETQVKNKEIEHLIMKALSLGLLRGKIDQVDEVARINWVQPKVLEKTQIEGMRQRLKEWDSNVNDLGHWIEGVGKDVWAA